MNRYRQLRRIGITANWIGVMLGVCFQNLCIIIGLGVMLIANCIMYDKDN